MAEENNLPALDELVKKMGPGIVQAYAKGATFREIKGISDAEVEALYAVGLEQFKSGKYETSRKVFYLLSLLEHTSPKIWTALGASYQALKAYPKAIKCYQTAQVFDLHNPKPCYYAAECFAKTGDKKNALSALACLDLFAPKDTEAGRTYREKGAALKASIEAA